ncbi:protein FAM133A [Vigna radiata var. radiata]|uniref:Protein FAM133A n=1 Tax=Vigna radiata var. radiata TaxID=3916 RepID=A0A1S3UGD7_VIGRR|nr:protein FAM133A [Vigna radiata var. radiata]
MATTEDNGKKEGTNLLGSPTFTELGNGRFRCVETGHEVLSKDIASYSNSKKCRLGLIDFALSNRKAPLNMFKQDPLSRSKLICKLTGDNVNKSEEHIWKHMSGKRFLNKLEREEEEKLSCQGMEVEDRLEESKSADGGGKDKKKKKKKKKNKGIDEESLLESKSANAGEKDRMMKKKKNKDTTVEEIRSGVRESSVEDSDAEEEDFWMPPVGDRWDQDDGGDRWGSESESDSVQEIEDGNVIDGAAVEDCEESEELSSRTKRMSIEIGPSSFATRKKKSKSQHT